MFSIRNPQSAIRNLALFVAAALTLACADGAGSSKPPVENTPVSRTGAEKEDKTKTTAFDGERAFNHVKAQVESGARPPSSPAIEKTREKTRRNLDFTYPITYYRHYDPHRCT